MSCAAYRCAFHNTGAVNNCNLGRDPKQCKVALWHIAGEEARKRLIERWGGAKKKLKIKS